MDAEKIRAILPDCPWTILTAEETDSTNNALKRLPDAPGGTVLLSDRQTGGRGRLGRCFASPAGGLYLSVLLRPDVAGERLLHLTPVVAVAVRRAIHDFCGLSVEIKWINDLVFGGKKLGGILTELVTSAGSNRPEGVIIGIGLNCNTLPENVTDMAVSLAALTGKPVRLELLAAAIIKRLREMETALFTEKEAWLQEYADACVTLNRTVQVIRGDMVRMAYAFGLDENGGLRVRYANGEVAVISSGEVSVRGMYGYVK